MKKLLPLTPERPGWASEPRIHCIGCATSCGYNIALVNGWRYDPNGPAFVAYYCPICVQLNPV